MAERDRTIRKTVLSWLVGDSWRNCANTFWTDGRVCYANSIPIAYKKDRIAYVYDYRNANFISTRVSRSVSTCLIIARANTPNDYVEEVILKVPTEKQYLAAKTIHALHEKGARW